LEKLESQKVKESLRALKKAIDRCAEEPSLIPQLFLELEQKSGWVVDSLMRACKEEYRTEVGEIILSLLHLVRACVVRG